VEALYCLQRWGRFLMERLATRSTWPVHFTPTSLLKQGLESIEPGCALPGPVEVIPKMAASR
jgi:hypothetical protein